jgi:hypothetical protein
MVTVLNQNDIQLLGELPDLTILRLHVMPVNEGNNNLDFCVKINNLESESHYKKVRVLEIACSSSLTVTFGSKAMKNLEVLKSYSRTESVTFSDQENLENLKVNVRYDCEDWTAPAAQATAQLHSSEDQVAAGK